VLKDNYHSADMSTTGGSLMREGSVPSDETFLVRKRRPAGAVSVGKADLSEFASTGAISSFGGQMLIPHDLARAPADRPADRGSRPPTPTSLDTDPKVQSAALRTRTGSSG
jgi:Asp-tRNA(Asn)/Glu-tRNA(Gln) amidotransferase A subunit family amidase